MRLIDADALPKYTGYALSADEVAMAVENAPTIDAEPVVRCKDCKHGRIDDCDFPNQYLCEYRGSDWNNGDHYCSYGERKDNEQVLR